MLERGYWKVGSGFGAPVRLHWTIIVGALLFGGQSFAPAFWIGFVLLVLCHELGHAWLVRRYGFHVVSIDVTGFGGMCRWQGRANPFEKSMIAWGGVMAQGLLLVAAAVIVLIVGMPRNIHLLQLVDLFTRANLMLIVLNLLPFAPLDGADAWSVFRYLDLRKRNHHAAAKRPKSDTNHNTDRSSPFRSRRYPKTEPAKIIDIKDYSNHCTGKSSQTETGTSADAKRLADEFIRIAEEAAKHRGNKPEN